MRDYWTAAQDNADSFLGYAGAGFMRFLGDVGYSGAEMAAAIYDDPQGAFVGASKAIVNFGPESFNGLTNLTKTSLNGWTMLAEATIAPQGTFAGFRDSDPYNIELLAPYRNRAEAGGAFLANAALGVGLVKYGNVALQSPVYLDLQQGAVAYSNIPIGFRNPVVGAPPYSPLSQAGGLSATEGQSVLRYDGRLSEPTHPLAKHGPNVTDQYIYDRVATELAALNRSGLRTAFNDRGQMEAAIDKTFAIRRQDIDAWLATSPRAGVPRAFPANPGMGNLGRGYQVTSKGGPIMPIMQPMPNVNLVLMPDGKGGFLIHTAHPM